VSSLDPFRTGPAPRLFVFPVVTWEGNTAKTKGLTLRERRFLRLVLVRGLSLKDAYAQTANPNQVLAESTADSNGCRLYARIKAKLGAHDWQGKLDAVDLGDTRLLEEISAGLRAMKTEFYQGVAVADCEDNGTRQRARELLADILGKRKAPPMELSTLAPLLVEIVRPPPRQIDPPTATAAPPSLDPDLPAGGTAIPPAPLPGAATAATPPRGLTIRHLDGTELHSDG